MMRKRCAVILSILLISSGCAAGRVVRVIDTNGNPIADAEIEPISLSINGNKFKTNARGEARVPTNVSLQKTEWIAISKPGYLPSPQIPIPATWPLTVTLTPAAPPN